MIIYKDNFYTLLGNIFVMRVFFLKCIFFLLFTIPFALASFAQIQGRKIIDSLLKELPKAGKDTNKVALLNELSNQYSGYFTDSGILYGAQAAMLANELNWEQGLANANYYLGFNYYNKSDYPDALEYLFKSLKAYETIADEEGIANTTRKIGNVYRDQRNYVKSLDCYFKALKVFERKGDKLGIGKCYSNIGELYGLENKNAEALKYDTMALNIDKEIGYKNGMVIAYFRIGSVYNNQEKYRDGLDCRLKGLAIVLANNDISVIPKEQIEEAYGGVGECYLNIAKYTLSHKNDTALQKSIYYLNNAISVSKEMGQLTDLQKYYNYLSEANALSGKYLNAYENLLLSYQLQDSLFSAENNIKDKIAKLEKIKKRNETLAIIAGFAAMLIIISIIFRNNKLLSFEKKKSDDLLRNILPSEVAEELKNKGVSKPKYFENVTVLFTDFVNFTSAGEKMSPQNLIDELHTCFKTFDVITAKYNIEKIKTIGDAYLAVAGLPMADPNHAQHVVSAAIEINNFMESRYAHIGDRTFQVRIGIHSGSVVAGIVGVKKFAYDIWGDTVNTAARMEQNSEPGKINISQITHDLVKDKFNCEYRGEIDAKNKGQLKMYFVV